MASFCRSSVTACSRSMAARSKTLAQKTLNPKPVSSAFASSLTGITKSPSRVLGSVESLMPFHSATANARLRSNIAVDSSCWSWLSQARGFLQTLSFDSFLGSNPISWSSKKQQTVARSSTEAEFKAVANSASKVSWVQNLLRELQIQSPASPIILCDNVGVLYLSKNPAINTRMKHVAVDFHYVRNLVLNKHLQVQHVHAKDQLADMLTKPLAKTMFHVNLSKLGVASNYKLEGDV